MSQHGRSVILKAGRIAEEHEVEVLDTLREQGKHHLTFIDFLAYVPLFVDIHDDINSNPTHQEKRQTVENLLGTKMMGMKWKKKGGGFGKKKK
jgi:hypothetical protein